MKNKIYNIRYEDFIETETALREDKTLFIGEIDGREIKSLQDYFNKISEIFDFPLYAKHFGGYGDWMEDLDWLEKDGYALIIYNYSEFMKDDLQSKNDIIRNFNDFILPFWEEEVEICVAGGIAKPFNVYLVDEVPENHLIRTTPISTVNRADREKIRIEKEIQLNPPESEDKLWRFVNTGSEGNCKIGFRDKLWRFVLTTIGNRKLFSVNIFDYDCKKTEDKIYVFYPEYNQKYEMTVYKTNIGEKTVIFAVGEFSSGIYGFYVKEPQPTEIDVRNCANTNEISGLLAEKLNLPEWNDKKPDELLKNLKELKDCEIHIIGANLLPVHISSYVDNVFDILNKVKEMYSIVSVVKMDVKTIDFTDCKYFDEVHLLLKKELNFPEWYGENLSALWDLLQRGKPSEIYLKGLTDVSKDLLDYMQKILNIFKKAETEYNYKIITE